MGLIPIMTIQFLPTKELAMSLIKSCLEIVYEMCMSLLSALHLFIFVHFHRIHVWYICLSFMVNVGKYTSPMNPMGFFFNSLDFCHLLKGPGFQHHF